MSDGFFYVHFAKTHIVAAWPCSCSR
jgi:hypothetical protein